MVTYSDNLSQQPHCFWGDFVTTNPVFGRFIANRQSIRACIRRSVIFEELDWAIFCWRYAFGVSSF